MSRGRLTPSLHHSANTRVPSSCSPRGSRDPALGAGTGQAGRPPGPASAPRVRFREASVPDGRIHTLSNSLVSLDFRGRVPGNTLAGYHFRGLLTSPPLPNTQFKDLWLGPEPSPAARREARPPHPLALSPAPIALHPPVATREHTGLLASCRTLWTHRSHSPTTACCSDTLDGRHLCPLPNPYPSG